MTRFLLALTLLLLALPVAAQARPGDPDRRYGRQGTVTLRATEADAVGGAVKVLSGNRVLAGGSAGGQLVDRAAAAERLARQPLRHRRAGRARAARHLARRRARARDLPRRADRRRRHAAARPTARRSSSPSACCPTGEIDPSFGAGFGYVLAGPVGAELDTMTMDRTAT